MENEIKSALALLSFRREELRGEVSNMIRVARFYLYIPVTTSAIHAGTKCQYNTFKTYNVHVFYTSQI